MIRKKYTGKDKFKGKPFNFQIMTIKHCDKQDDLEFEDPEKEIIEETDRDYEERYKITLFGVTEAGNSVQVDVLGFHPYFLIEVPDDFTKTKMGVFIDYFNSRMYKPYKNCIIKSECKLIERERLVGFTNHKKFKFVRFVFDNLQALRKCSYQFYYEHYIPGITKRRTKFKVYESNIEPMIRFLHINELEPAGWVTINNYKTVKSEYSTCRKYVQVHMSDVKHFESKKVAPYITAAFDIECTSLDGSFPKANRPEDKVIMIGTTFKRYGEKNSFLKVIHTLKDSDPIDGVVIESCETEKELLISWRNMIQSMDPDFIYGYNSNGFDFQYMYDRARLLRCGESFLQVSRNKFDVCKFVIKELSSSAMGDNKLKYIDMEGRIIMDVMKEIQKNPKYKLDSYKLDAVAKHFTGQSKVDLSPAQLFKNYRKGKPKHIRKIAVYCLQDVELCHYLTDKLKLIVGAIKMGNVCNVPIEYIFSRGQGVKIFSLVAKIARKQGKAIPVIRKEYLNKDKMTPEAYKAAVELQKKMASYDGALVIETAGGLFYDPVGVLDFNSLYPSCEIAWNISHDTLVLDDRYDNMEGIEYYEIEYKEWDDSIKKCRYVKNDGDKNKGIIPTILRTLLDTRKAVKNKMKETDDETELMLLDCEQAAYKVVANSIYGQTGATTSPIYLKDIAACTTAKGREMLEMAKDVAEREFPNVECIYGDTDSNFYLIKDANKFDDPELSDEEILRRKIEYSIDLCKKMSVVINKAIDKPGIINFAYEKVLCPFLIITKKRYYGHMYEEDPTKFVIKVMGIAIVRRNYCKYVKSVMQSLFDIIMASVYHDEDKIKKFMIDCLDKLVDDKVPIEELVMSQTLKKDYKNPAGVPHKVLADRMIERGENVNTNDRIAYVYVMREPKCNTRGTWIKSKIVDVVEEVKYVKDKQNNVFIDPEIYITSQMREPLSQILEMVIDTDDIKEIFDDAIKRCRDKKINIFGEPEIPKPKRRNTIKILK